MDIFKIRLNKALSSNRIGKLEAFLLKEGQRNKDKIRKYADYILKNCSDYNWITSYLIMYDGDELIDAIINNYNKLKENNIDTYPIINRITKYPNDKLISYIDKLIPVIDDFTLRNILDKIKDNEEVMNYIIEKYLINSTISIKLTSFLLKNNLYIDKVYQNFDNIISNNIKDLYELKKQGTLNKETSTKISKIVQNNEEYLNNTIEDILKEIYGEKFNSKDFKVGIDTIKIIIKELCQNENKTYGDIEYLGKGTFSYVLAVGDKVLKIGIKRYTDSFPNNPYIITPLLRESIKINEENKIFLEVTERVDTKTEVTTEELYQLYKKIRALGLVWTDVAKRNVGRLKKDNIVHWNTPLYPTDEALELKKYINASQLKKGDLIILDADHIYEGYKYNLTNKEFEDRYQEELKEKNKYYETPVEIQSKTVRK
mgnify:FL=1